MVAGPDPILVVVPTYNERENLPRLVAGILRHLPGAGVLVVDDNSPDGTGGLADGLAREHQEVAVLHRLRREGLTAAYREAFQRALGEGAGAVITMDADFSHDPASLPAIAAALDIHDLVVGSRYVPGGGVVNWPLRRRVLSRSGNWYARALTGLPVRDCTSGFVGYRRRVLEVLLLATLRSRGYAYTVETKFLAYRAGFSLGEVPIVFRERDGGRSKMSAAIALEAFWRVPLLRLAARIRPVDGE